MADNRMFLVHRPTGIGVILGKRMAWGWYGAPDPETLERFYDLISDKLAHPSQDDFILVMEDPRESSCIEATYTAEKIDGFMRFSLEQ